MAGAYTAKAAVVSSPDVPPGWKNNWPRPGDPALGGNAAPFPPGYTTDYSIVTTATANIAPTGTASCTSSVRDRTTYATNEPSAITWTATINGEAIDLKFDGGEFASSISENPVWGTYWGTTPDIIFDLDDDNDGDTVILRASCTLRNSESRAEVLIGTSEIAISATRYSVVITAILSAGYSYGYSGHVRVRAQMTRDSDSATIWGHIQYSDSPVIEQSYDALDEASVVTDMKGQDVGGDSVIITSTELNADEIYDLVGYVDGYRPDVAGTVRILVTEEISSTVIYDYTANLAASDPSGSAIDAHWVKFDTSDGSHTVITA
jgi:hypothetical protein